MANRTNNPNVLAILQTEYDSVSEPMLDAYIATANSEVNYLANFDRANLVSGDPVRLELIERWLAAHMYQAGDPGYKSRTTSGATGQFGGNLDKFGYMSTRFGQVACSLDVTGYLARRSKEIEEGSRRTVQLYAPNEDNCYPSTSFPPSNQYDWDNPY